MVTLDQYKEAAAAATRREWCVVIALGVTFFSVFVAFRICWKPLVDASIVPIAQWTVQHGIGPRLTKVIFLIVKCVSCLPNQPSDVASFYRRVSARRPT